MMTKRFKYLMVTACATALLTGCFAPKYTAAEQEMAETLSGSNFQPATREVRDNIETQDLLAQAAFWSREHSLNPGDLEAAIKLAASVRKMGNPGQAIEITQQTRALYPRDPYLAAEYAAALIASERGVEAIDTLDTALRTTPGYARLWSLKGAALDQMENYEFARKHYAKALQITPYDPNILANVGLSYALAGDAKTAEKWLRRAADIPGAGPSVRQNLAIVLQLQGKNDEASRLLPQQKSASLSMRQNYQPQNYTSPRTSVPQRRLPQAKAPQRVSPPATSQSASQNYYLGPQSAAGAPQSASDAARAAARNMTRSRTIEPVSSPSAEQKSILDQLARNVGPKPALAGAAPIAPAPSHTTNEMTPTGAYVAPQYSGQPVKAKPQVPLRRGAARRR